jgi:endonuclease III
MKNAEKILKILKREYPKARIALEFKTPMQMLASTILSAQCTDKMVNIVTKNLFRKYKTVKDFAAARQETFEKEIRRTGFYKNKARNIINSARLILEKFGGKIPGTMEDITTLPGVARKTANIVLFNVHGIVAGIPVDTHVRRLSQRLGFTKNDDPVKIEQDLMAIIPEKEWGTVSYFIIEHGRKVCHAQRPDCPGCVLKKLCPSFGKFQ